MKRDFLRGFSIDETNATAVDLERKIEFRINAQVYSVGIQCWGEIFPGTVTLKTKDSELVVNELSPYRADYPEGILWPAFARLVIPPGVRAILYLSYGECR